MKMILEKTFSMVRFNFCSKVLKLGLTFALKRLFIQIDFGILCSKALGLIDMEENFL